jgi:outer membrane protein assembly factor BamB
LVDFRPDGRLETMCYDEFDVLKAPVSLPNGDLIFPCRSKFGVQIVHAESQTLDKVCQTQTWKVPTLEDFLVIGDTAFAILGKSFVVACDMKTGALKWRKFYSGIVNPQLIPYHNGILYTCQNVLYHVMDGKDAVVIRIPSTQIDRLECVIGNRLYAIATDSSTILCIDLLHKRLLWELATRSKIEKTVAAKA